MVRLVLSLFGGFDARLDGERVACFDSDKGRALLAYLAVESEHPHRRESLAALLWPERPEAVARGNLRHVLHLCRSKLEPFLFITPQDIQFNAASGCWFDTAAFEAALAVGLKPQTADAAGWAAQAHALEEAIGLYCGEFLAGFGAGGSETFQTWLVVRQEHYHRLALTALRMLADGYEAQGDYGRAADWAQRQIDLEPWGEAAHRQKMRCLALDGQASAALRHYDICRKLLERELGIPPAAATVALRDRIRAGEFDRQMRQPIVGVGPLVATGAPRPEDRPPAPPVPPRFVARQEELAVLAERLQATLRGEGQIVLLHGAAGGGKTALVCEFARRGLAGGAGPSHLSGRLLVAGGRCSAQAAAGDPYLPFREISSILLASPHVTFGDAALAADIRLRLAQEANAAVAAMTAAVLEHGRNLPGVLLPEDAWSRWDTQQPRPGVSHRRQDRSQAALFSQYTAVLRALAARRPLLLILEDLQWADEGTVALLFHLARRLGDAAIMLICTYRSEDAGAPPLAPVLVELQRDWGSSTIDLDRSDGRVLVEELVDTEPNRLGATFRDTLYRATAGHPLFTVEMLRDLYARGDLARDAAGRWVEAGIDWRRRPSRVEAAIAGRLASLPADLCSLLSAASVEGEEFVAEVAAAITGMDARAALAQLGLAARRYDLVQAEGVERIDGRQLSHYRFRHALFQQYLYEQLDAAERMALHQAAGEELAALCRDTTGAIPENLAPRLAYHFDAAGLIQPAVGYLLVAGRRALRLAAISEAIRLFERGLALIRTTPPAEERRHRELELLMALADAHAQQNWGAPEAITYATEARDLLRPDDPPEWDCDILGLLTAASLARGAAEDAYRWARLLTERAEAMQSLIWIARGYAYQGCITVRDHVDVAIQCFERAAAVFRRGEPAPPTLHTPDIDITYLVWYALAQLARGQTLHARQLAAECLAQSRRAGFPALTALHLAVLSVLHSASGPPTAASVLDAELAQIASAEDLPIWYAASQVLRGWSEAQAGDPTAGLARIHSGITAWKGSGMQLFQPFMHLVLAKALAQAGELEAARAAISEGIAVAEAGPRYLLAELWRVRGEILAQSGAAGAGLDAKVCFQQALAIARNQGALLWELRAATSLARLAAQQGQPAEAHAMLNAVYAQFTEGFSQPDLCEARKLLDSLQRAKPNGVSDTI